MPSHTDVLIVGAGPTGLILAHELARRNVACRIVDRQERPPPLARATAIKTRSLEIFAEMGIVDRFLEEGLRVDAIETYVEGQYLSTINLGSVQSPYTSMLSLGQERTEAIVTERLRDLGVEVERGCELAGIENRDGNPKATLRSTGGALTSLEASWIVGCDGHRSSVRAAMGLDLEGHLYPDCKLLALVTLEHWANPRFAITTFFDSEGQFHCQELPGKRYLLTASGKDLDSPAYDTPEAQLAYWRNRVARAMQGAGILEADWLKRFQIRLGVAPRYRRGRLFIAGDAAHLFSPFGAFGMNSGIQDAYNLGWKLALVCGNQAEERILDSYEAERRPVALAAGRVSDQAERYVMDPETAKTDRPTPRLGSQPRYVQLQAVAQIADLTIHYRSSPLSGCAPAAPQDSRHRLRWLGPEPGERLPDAWPLIDGEGQAASLHQAAWNSRATLLLLLGEADEARLRSARALLESARAAYGGSLEGLLLVQADRPPQTDDAACRVLADPTDAAHRCLGVTGDTAFLVRPDGYLAFRAAPPCARDLAGFLQRVGLTRVETATREAPIPPLQAEPPSESSSSSALSAASGGSATSDTANPSASTSKVDSAKVQMKCFRPA